MKKAEGVSSLQLKRISVMKAFLLLNRLCIGHVASFSAFEGSELPQRSNRSVCSMTDNPWKPKSAAAEFDNPECRRRVTDIEGLQITSATYSTDTALQTGQSTDVKVLTDSDSLQAQLRCRQYDHVIALQDHAGLSQMLFLCVGCGAVPSYSRKLRLDKFGFIFSSKMLH